MTFSFRPTLEPLDARDLPTVTLYNTLVTSARPEPPPAHVAPVVLAAPTTPPESGASGYNVIAPRKV